MSSSTTLPQKSNANSIIDVAKFILSLFVVAIHTGLFPEYLYPWLSMAVPIFFIISAYFFFTKVKSAKSETEKNSMLAKYVLRNIKLYAFYFVLFAPLTIYNNPEWYSSGFLLGMVYFIRAVVFGTTFRASWFISAQVVGIVLLFFMSKKLNNVVIMIISTGVLALILLSSSYNWTLDKSNGLNVFFENFTWFFSREMDHTFTVAFVWCSIGKCMAEAKKPCNKYLDIGYIVAGIILCIVEHRFILNMTGKGSWTLYASLFILCPAICSLMNKATWYFPASKYFRNASTIIYASHFSIFTPVLIVLKKLNIATSPILFVSLTFVCIVFSIVILLLEKKIKFLKYAH